MTMMQQRISTLAPDEHECAKRASSVFMAARIALDGAFDYLGATDTNDTVRMRLALGAIVVACDALKATANAYSTMLGHLVGHLPRIGA